MASIEYRRGDATRPVGDGHRFIAHICNDVGGWGAGFVLALSKRWREPERAYREWYRGGVDFALGKVQVVPVGDGISVANMIGQTGLRSKSGEPPIRYGAVRECLAALAQIARKEGASVHMPRIGCGLAGGVWEEIEPLIEETLIGAGVDVVVYDFV